MLRTPRTLVGAVVAVALLAFLGACREDTPRGVPLRESAAALDRFIGFAANARLLCRNEPDCATADDSTYRGLAETEFSQVTPENALKWESTEPSDDQYTFDQADAIVAFAAAHDQSVHGHTLVWHSQTPSWVQNLAGDAMRAALQDHIASVVGRYAGNPVVTSWDVVNEAIDDGGQLRDTFWYQGLGEGYIADAFRYARQADPDADLCINDYGIEGTGAKSDRLYELVRSLQQQEVPITCVGFQGHLVAGQVPTTMAANLERFAALGLKVRITELDIRVPLPPDENGLRRQADDYADVVGVCRAVPACQGITTWGVDDGHSWLPNDYCCGFGTEGAPLLWDAQYARKPAYAAFEAALREG